MSNTPLPSRARLVIVGAGIVGCSTAYHLAGKGWDDIVVIDQGPLFETGGSTSHAPGLVFQTSSSRTLCLLAQETVKLYGRLTLDGQPCFHSVGSMEVAITPERHEDLKRRVGWAKSWGLDAELITAAEARRRIPLLDDSRVLSAYAVPSDGLAKAVRACEAMARAIAHQARFFGRTAVTDFQIECGRVTGVVTDQGTILADTVLICGGIWGPEIGRLAGIRIPLTPVEHPYVRTSALRELAGETREAVHPILRHQDRSMYFRQHGDCYGIGSYGHEPILFDAERIRRHGESADQPAINPFKPAHFEASWRDACELLPPLARTEQAYRINGMFSFTPDGFPVLGESHIKGLWVAEAVWVTHGGGVGQAMAEWLAEGQSNLDLHDCTIHRFDRHVYSRPYIRARGAQQYREVYDIIHPLQQMEQPRPLRVSPFHHRQKERGAVFFEGRGWERAQWFASNANLVNAAIEGKRQGWSARNWSPIAGGEHLATREKVALFDMTPLVRLGVEGRGALALLQRLASNQLDKPPGSVTYTCMLDARGGVLSDITVTRLGEQEFQIGCNGLQDLAWLKQHADDSVHVADITPGTCCLGLWGPNARAVIQPLVEDDWSNGGFPYFTARKSYVGEVPVTAQRVSYVGELGWEIYTTADYGQRLWDLLWNAGERHCIIAAGRAAFESLRIEKGYRLWGVDMDSDYTPDEAGLGFTVKLDKGEFIGRAAVAQAKEAGPRRKLCCLVLDDPSAVVLAGKEPILSDGKVMGYVTSATYGFSVDRSIAYGYLPVERSAVGSRVEIESFAGRYAATVAKEPLYDPKGERLKS